VLKTLHKLGLDRTEKVNVSGVKVSPRDVVAACLPNPATLGPKMRGGTCAGLWVTGTGTDGNRGRRIFTTSLTTSGRWPSMGINVSSGRPP
jgi:saccharopine dehydrogenase-like NADP-dependent oxidoreductase